MKTGNNNLAFSNVNSGFTGAIVLNAGSAGTGYLGFSGSGSSAASSITLNKGTAFLIDNNGTTRSSTRIPDATPITLNSADGAFQGETIVRGLAIRINQNAETSETIGNLVFNSGANYLSGEASGTTGISSIIATNFVRNNNSTVIARGRAMGATSGDRNQFRIGNTTNQTSFISNALVGGSGAAGSATLKIVPWAIGETISAALADTNMGNSFATYVSGSGFRALDFATEYSTFAAKASVQDNIRESRTADLTGVTGQTINSLALHNNNTSASTVNFAGTGAGQSLTLTSGALLFTLNPSATASSAHATTLGGFDSGIRAGSTNEYVFSVVNPSSAANTPTLTATISSPLNSAGASLTKSGRGTLILTGTNTYTGTTTLNEGVLQIGSLNNLGNGGAIQFSGGTLKLASGFAGDLSTRALVVQDGSGGTIDTNGNSIALANGLDATGTGTLVKTGNGSITIQGSSTFTGLLVVGHTNIDGASGGALGLLLDGDTNAAIRGDLHIGNLGSIPNTNVDVLVHLADDEQIIDTASVTFRGSSGESAYLKLLGHTETVAGIADTTGYGIIENLQDSEAGVATNGKLIVNSAADFSFNGYLRNRGGGSNATTLAFEKQGSGTQTLSGINITHTGLTTVTGGTLQLQDVTNWQSDITNNAALVLNQTTGSRAHANAIGGSGTVTKLGAGTVALTGTNTYSGVTSILNGVLSINNSSALGSNAPGNAIEIHGNATLQSTGASVVLGANQSVSLCSPVANIDVSGAASNTLTVQGIVSGVASAALEKEGAGTLLLAGSNTYTGATVVNAGTVSISAEENLGANPGAFNAGQLTLNGGTLRTTADVTLNDSNRGVTLGASGGTILADAGTTATFASGNVITGPGNLVKEGAGILLLNATNTYAGSTNVNAGTLGGTGTLSGTGVNINSTATLAAGDPVDNSGVGELHFGGTDLNLNDSSTWLVDVVMTTTGNADQLEGMDAFTIGASALLSLNFTGTYTWGNSYTLASYSSLSGRFSAYDDGDDQYVFHAGGGQWMLDYRNGNSITLTAIPEPEAWLPALLILALGSLFFRRRRQVR